MPRGLGVDRLGRAAVQDVDERIDVAGREGDDARILERLRHHRRNVGVHRPGQILAAGRAELPSGHEDDVRRLGQTRDRLAIEQIGGDAFDAPGFELFAQARFAEASNAENPAIRRGATREPRQRRSHLAADRRAP